MGALARRLPESMLVRGLSTSDPARLRGDFARVVRKVRRSDPLTPTNSDRYKGVRRLHSEVGHRRKDRTVSSTTAETNAERASTRVHAGMGSRPWARRFFVARSRTRASRDITVVNKAISNLTDDVDLLVTHQDSPTGPTPVHRRQPSTRWTTSWAARSTTRSSSTSRSPTVIPVRGRPACRHRGCCGGWSSDGDRDPVGHPARHRLDRPDGTAADRDGAISACRRTPARQRRRRPGLCRLDARAREVGLDLHGQPARHSPRHERGQGWHPPPAPAALFRPLPGRHCHRGKGKPVSSSSAPPARAMTTWASRQPGEGLRQGPGGPSEAAPRPRRSRPSSATWRPDNP